MDMSNLHKIEWVEPEGVKVGGQTKLPGTVEFVSKQDRDLYVGLGWAKCAASGECGERKPGAVAIGADNIRVKAIR